MTRTAHGVASSTNHTGVLLLLAGALTACTSPADHGKAPLSSGQEISSTAFPHPYVGMWVTADDHIRQELLPNGRYDEARGTRRSAYTGSYRISGNQIDYADDTGFQADGTFDGDVLHHGGYLFYREGSAAHDQAKEQR